MPSALSLYAVNSGIVEEPGTARAAFVVAKAIDDQVVGKAAGFDDGDQLHFAAFRTRKWFRYPCFF
jgi:hypothetical protein